MDHDDLLAEILLRLPPLPSSLPPVSLVCKRWRRLLADPNFLRRFRARHSKAPMLGVFFECCETPVFTPTLDPPDSVPAARFSLPFDARCRLMDCRNGLVLLIDANRYQALVWEPVTADLLSIPLPLSLCEKAVDNNQNFFDNAAVLCSHGHSSTFLLLCLRI